MRARGASFVILTASCLPSLSLCAEGARFEDLYREALARREQNLGPRHPEVARSLAHLALFLNVRGRTAEAEPLLRGGRWPSTSKRSVKSMSGSRMI